MRSEQAIIANLQSVHHIVHPLVKYIKLIYYKVSEVEEK